MAYIDHFGYKTANATFGRRRYAVMANFAKVRGMRKLHGSQWRKQLPPGTLPPPPCWKIVASETYTSIPLGDDPVGQFTRDGRTRVGPPDIDYRAAAVGLSDNGFAGVSVGGQPWLVGNQRSSGEKMPNTTGYVSLRCFSICSAANVRTYITKSLGRLPAPAWRRGDPPSPARW